MTKVEPAEPPPDTAPVRTCVGCRRRRPIGRLLRITGAGGTIVVGGPSDGRGAWLCRDSSEPVAVDEDCLAAALGGRSFERAFRRALGHDERHSLARLASGRHPA